MLALSALISAAARLLKKLADRGSEFLAGIAQAQRYARTWPEAATRLAAAFWPGPLTIVVPRTDEIVPEVSAGLGTVGLRCPRHPLALKLLERCDGPIAAPSANRSNRISPTTAQHVREELGDRVDLLLDGGPCQVGIESTVITLCTEVPTVLRPGDSDVVRASAGDAEGGRHPGRGVTGRRTRSPLGVDVGGDRRVVDLDRRDRRPAEHDDVRAAWLAQLERAERAAHDGLVQLGQLPGDGDRPIRPAHLSEVGDRAGDAVRDVWDRWRVF